MAQSYVINELYLKDISLQTTWSSLCPDDIHQNVHIDVSANLIDNDDVKLCVELKVIITKSHNNEDLLKLEVTYATVVSNIDTNDLLLAYQQINASIGEANVMPYQIII